MLLMNLGKQGLRNIFYNKTKPFLGLLLQKDTKHMLSIQVAFYIFLFLSPLCSLASSPKVYRQCSLTCLRGWALCILYNSIIFSAETNEQGEVPGEPFVIFFVLQGIAMQFSLQYLLFKAQPESDLD
ncbi:hypothetical protein CRENBAI_009899 [Crenichthys baileyi]|uniref:Uncharacterized protein n=1 Tax=Crenichthys baileyi TaxID=28760 RepID=A0AAV9SLI5_9TELE